MSYNKPNDHIEKKIQTISRIMIWLTTIGGVALIALFVGVSLNEENLAQFLQKQAENTGIEFTFTPATQSLALIAAIVPFVVFLYILFQVRNLFVSYYKKEIFSHSASNLLRHIGIMILCLVPIRIFSSTAIILLGTFHNGENQRQLSIGFSSNDYTLIIFGGLIMTIGWVMSQAATLTEEYKQII